MTEGDTGVTGWRTINPASSPDASGCSRFRASTNCAAAYQPTVATSQLDALPQGHEGPDASAETVAFQGSNDKEFDHD
jgi:hypothetical protein